MLGFLVHMRVVLCGLVLVVARRPYSPEQKWVYPDLFFSDLRVYMDEHLLEKVEVYIYSIDHSLIPER